MKQLLCEHPVIILNPSFRANLLRYKVYFLNGEIHHLNTRTYNEYLVFFPYVKFSWRLNGVTESNMDNFYVLNPYTSETYPMYLRVPCGKCIFCREKKAREWSFRSLCENATAETPPLFVTLTYNNKHLPKCGVFKEEIQLFLKRVRSKLDRLKITHNLRYFACAEYGSKSGRPHYHLIIWNFPMLTSVSARLHFIESCWTKTTGSYDKNGAPITESLGFAYCLPCERGAISYVMKYMRKEPYVPFNMNPVFFLSSRRNGGIGAAYARKFVDFYRIHPECLDLTVCDPFSGQSFTSVIPAYFKRIFYPCLSQCVSKEIRDAHKKLCWRISMRHTFHDLLGIVPAPRLHPFERRVLKKFSFLNNMLATTSDESDYHRLASMDKSYIVNEFDINELEIDSLVRYLSIESYPTAYIKNRDRMLSVRSSALSARFDNIPEINLKDAKYSLISKAKFAELKEKI